MAGMSRLPEKAPRGDRSPEASPGSPDPLGGDEVTLPGPPSSDSRGILPGPLGVEEDATSDGASSSTEDWAAPPFLERSQDELLAAFPLPPEGRYTPVAFLGDGGMGRVYKAFDKKLNRIVAMKFMRHLATGSLERFLQEGRAQAQIEHPNVVSIYSVGQVDGQPYLSMRYIDGPNLRAALPKLNLEQKVGIIQEVAEALQACHRLGIIHRDVKPSNIMLEATEKGTWWPFVMDFGLAREQESDSLTATGVIVGTPAYCSPEQVQGRLGEIDRRSDVYSLGATLYECLCGEAPFSARAGIVDLVQQIVEVDPIPPSRRVPNLPKDLETITLKALEKDPARRYESAKAMADDLKRYLEGDPIVARASSLTYRLGKRVRKNRPLAVALAGSLVLFLALGGFGIMAVVRVRTQAASSQRFSRAAEQVETLLFRSHSLPLHDITPERRQAEAQMEAIQADMARLGRWSAPAGHLALGRCQLALGRPAEALPELEKAWQASRERDPEVAHALGLALSRVYLAEIEHLRGKDREDRKREMDASHRKRAAACFKLAQGLQLESPAFVEAMLAFIDDRFEDALEQARKAQLQMPWHQEARVLEADILMAQAQETLGRGDYPKVIADLETAGRSLAKAMDLARSAPRPLEREIQRRILHFRVKENKGIAERSDYLWVMEAVTQARKAEPSNWKVCSHASSIHRYWGTVQMTRREDPGDALTSAIAEAEAGLVLRPDSAGLSNDLVTALRYLARQKLDLGQDPEPIITRAIEVAQRALKGSQLRDYLLNNLGNCLEFRALLQMSQGQDPEPTVRQAVACLQEAASLKPWVGHASSEGYVNVVLATYQDWMGRDNSQALADGLKALHEANRLNANSYRVNWTLCRLHLLHAQRTGLPPQEAAREVALAHQAFGRTLALNPALPEGAALEASILAAEARVSIARFRPQLQARGLRALQGAVVSAERTDARESRVLESAGDLQEAGAVLPAHLAARLLALGDRTVARQPWDAWTHFQRGRLLHHLDRISEASPSLQKALQLNPNLARMVKRMTEPERRSRMTVP